MTSIHRTSLSKREIVTQSLDVFSVERGEAAFIPIEHTQQIEIEEKGGIGIRFMRCGCPAQFYISESILDGDIEKTIQRIIAFLEYNRREGESFPRLGYSKNIRSFWFEKRKVAIEKTKGDERST